MGCLLIAIVSLTGCGSIQPRGGHGEGLGKAHNPDQSYRLGPHDVLALEVFGEPDLTKQMEINGQVSIKVPLLGELDIEGKTVKEVEDDITVRLKAGYFKDPKVTLSIVRYRNFYVHGEVRNPGAFPYQTGLTVLKAITHAGGFTDRAAKGRIKVIRLINGKEERISGAMDVLIQPDDIVLIPESFF